MLLHFQLHAVVNYCCLGVQATGGCIWKIETVFCEVKGRRSLSIEASLFLIYSPPVAANEFLQDVWLLSSAVALSKHPPPPQELRITSTENEHKINVNEF